MQEQKQVRAAVSGGAEGTPECARDNDGAY